MGGARVGAAWEGARSKKVSSRFLSRSSEPCSSVARYPFLADQYTACPLASSPSLTFSVCLARAPLLAPISVRVFRTKGSKDTGLREDGLIDDLLSAKIYIADIYVAALYLLVKSIFI